MEARSFPRCEATLSRDGDPAHFYMGSGTARTTLVRKLHSWLPGSPPIYDKFANYDDKLNGHGRLLKNPEP